jgi:hypothetical protein
MWGLVCFYFFCWHDLRDLGGLTLSLGKVSLALSKQGRRLSRRARGVSIGTFVLVKQ